MNAPRKPAKGCPICAGLGRECRWCRDGREYVARTIGTRCESCGAYLWPIGASCDECELELELERGA